MRAATFFCSSAGSSLEILSAAEVALSSSGIEQPINARAVILGFSIVPIAVEDLVLHRRIELVVAPGRDDERVSRGLIAILQKGACERGLAGTSHRWRRREKGFDLVGACIVQEQGHLGPLAQLVLSGPIGVGVAELLDGVGWRTDAAALVGIPGGELAGRLVFDPCDCRLCRVAVTLVACAQRILEIGLVRGAKLIGEERLQDRSEVHSGRRTGAALHGDGWRGGRTARVAVRRRNIDALAFRLCRGNRWR